jgi:hypothetical protein
MEIKEFYHVLAAILIMTVVTGLYFASDGNLVTVTQAFIFSIIIILVSVLSKKIAAFYLEADVEHSIWMMKNFGFIPSLKLKKPVPMGLIAPLIVSVFSLGLIKIMTLLTYEARALKHRAAKRHGFYSFTEMTEWHHALIGTAGILAVLALAAISYFIPGTNLEYLSKIAAYYAFWNILPISKLDGSQIFFGSRILWATLAAITAIFASFALLI